MRTIDLDDLNVFRCVVREGGVTLAARLLNRVPSGVTTRIKQMEERLGVALFHRQGRGLTPTQAGMVLLGHAERLLHMADLAEQDVRGGSMRGPLRLGSLESTAGARLPPLLSAFHVRFPELAVELQTGTTDGLLTRVRRHELDAAFVSQPFDEAGLSSVLAFEEELVLITALDAPAVSCAADLGARTLLAFPRGCSYRRRLAEWLADAGVVGGRVLEFESYHAIVACVAGGTGVALMPAALLDQAVLGRSVRRHALPERLARNQTHLAWTGQASAALLELIAMMRDPGADRGS